MQEHSTLEAAYTAGREELKHLKEQVTARADPPLLQAEVEIDTSKRPTTADSNMTKEEFLEAVDKTKEYILSGDIFQLVLSQRFERRTFADPFEIYRALRVINPSPYMVYLQVSGAAMPSVDCITEFWSTSPCVSLSVCLSVCLSVFLPACLSFCLPACLSVCQSVCSRLSVWLSLSLYLSIYLSLSLSLSLSISLSLRLRLPPSLPPSPHMLLPRVW